MKDRLGKAKFVNLPPHNPTQTRWLRFMKQATSPLESDFTRSQRETKSMLENITKPSMYVMED